MLKRRSDLKDIKEKKCQLVDHMDQVPLDSKEFESAIKNYKELLEAENAIRDGKNKRLNERVVTGLKVLSLVVGAVGTIGIPVYLARMSYEHDINMDLKNSSIWNLIGKKFGNLTV